MTLRFALHVNGALGGRVRKVLLAEPDVEIVPSRGPAEPDPNGSVPGVAGCDALVVDSITPTARPVVEEAVSLGIPVVVGNGLPAGFPPSGGTFVVQAGTGAGLAAALASSMIDPPGPPVETRLAWTAPGPPLGAGIAVTFPEPVGPLWAGREENPLPWSPVTCLAAPSDSPWLGVSVRVRTRDRTGEQVRTLGIADEADFLAGICLAAAALAAAQGVYPPGAGAPGDPGGVFLERARAAGLVVAAFVPDRTPTAGT